MANMREIVCPNCCTRWWAAEFEAGKTLVCPGCGLVDPVGGGMNDVDRMDVEKGDIGGLALVRLCGAYRELIKQQEKDVRGLLDRITMPLTDSHEAHQQFREIKANITLAFRHLEDARMRLGKAIQYAGDGVSCYDKGEG